MFRYWPYDEVEFHFDSAKNEVGIKTPWLELNKAFAEEDYLRITQLAEKMAKEEVGAPEAATVQWLFSQLSDFPLSYILPMDKPAEPFRFSVSEREFASPLNLLSEMESSVGLSAQTVEALSAELEKLEWNWDAQLAIEFSSSSQGVCPESLLSVARRFHHLDVYDQPQGDWASFSQYQGEDLLNVCRLTVRQNHYVTEQCISSLEPGILNAGGAAADVKAFIEAERGHDKILERALMELGANPEDIPVAAKTKFLMKVLKFAAQQNFLAFTLLVDCFERSNYQENDPMAKLLIDAGYPKAAKMINRHMDINDMGGHENVSLSFLKSVPNCPVDYATEALRIAELGSYCISTMAATVKQAVPSPN